MYKELLLLLCMYKYITVNITEGHGQQKIWITGMLFFIVDYFLKCILFFFLGGGGYCSTTFNYNLALYNRSLCSC